MLHYALSVVYRDQSPTQVVRNMVARVITAAGGLTFPYGQPGQLAEKACRVISKHPAVDRVVLTLVREDNAGTWRKGRKS